MRLLLLVLVVVSFCGQLSVASDKQRVKRTPLVYPQPSTLLLIFGLGTPLQLDRESVIVGAFAKFMYNLPTNSSVYNPPPAAPAAPADNSSIAATTNTTSRSRWSLYKSLGHFLERLDFGSGRGCVLRAICEAASAPFDTSSGGLMHQLLQTFLTPSSSVEPEKGREEELATEEYEEAERKGKLQMHKLDGDNCHALYPDCRKSLLDVFSRPHHDAATPDVVFRSRDRFN